MAIKKAKPLKARGIRFSDEQWAKLEKEARKDRTGRTTPSDIVRHITDQYFEKKAEASQVSAP